MKIQTTKIAWVPVVVLVVVVSVGSFYLGSRHGAAKVQATIVERQAAAVVIKDESGLDEERVIRPVAEGSGASDPHAVEAVAAYATRQNIESEQKQRLMRNLENNLSMPGMSQIIQDQQRVLMADQFRDLIEAYGLNDEEQDYFLDLLTARRMYEVDMGMKLMTGMLSEDERNELLARVGAGIDEMNKEIDWFLNSEKDSGYFNYYEQTEGERTFIGEVGAHLSQEGHPLEKGAGEALVAIMHDEISNYPFSVQFEENGQPVFTRFTPGNIDTFVSEMQGLRDPIIQNASQVLNRQQLDLFANSFDRYVALYDQRLRMVQQLFNPPQ